MPTQTICANYDPKTALLTWSRLRSFVVWSEALEIGPAGTKIVLDWSLA